MTKPDEALLCAREHWANICHEDGFSDVAEAYRLGVKDETLSTDALFYRAGAAASEARIKVLEEALVDVSASLIAAISLLDGGGKKAAASDKMFEIMLSDYQDSVSRARALLKEGDQ